MVIIAMKVVAPAPHHLSDALMQNKQIARTINLVGQPQFLSALAELCQGASAYSSTFISAYFPDHSPVELYDNLASTDCAATIPPYISFAYMLDPFYTLFREGIGDAVVPLNDCAPDDFRASKYYKTFYADTGLFDETSMFINFPGGASLVISLGSRDAGFHLSPDGLAALQSLLPVIAALCRRHWPKLEASSIAGHGRMGLHLEKSFECFGNSALSCREAEIVRLVLKGHSSKSMARMLGNSPETIRVHRKRIYAKLNIASQGDLFSIFLDALAQTSPNATKDPLTYLDRKIAPRPVN